MTKKPRLILRVESNKIAAPQAPERVTVGADRGLETQPAVAAT
jgi:hypothetical protein